VSSFSSSRRVRKADVWHVQECVDIVCGLGAGVWFADLGRLELVTYCQSVWDYLLSLDEPTIEELEAIEREEGWDE